MINWNPIPDFRDHDVQLHTMIGATTSLGMLLITGQWLYIMTALLVVMASKEVWAYFNPDKYNVVLAHAVASGLGGIVATIAHKMLF